MPGPSTDQFTNQQTLTNTSLGSEWHVTPEDYTVLYKQPSTKPPLPCEVFVKVYQYQVSQAIDRVLATEQLLTHLVDLVSSRLVVRAPPRRSA